MTSAIERSAAAERPLVTMLLIAFNQQSTIVEAIEGVLAQDYSPLEIVLSDDASTDGSFLLMERAAKAYRGPHRLILNRNPRNLGIGAHLNQTVSLSAGELLFVCAGDDVSLPNRCSTVVRAWRESSRRLDLIASELIDLDTNGIDQGRIVPTDLSSYRDAADWIARPPHVVGAAQAWTRRVFDRFGPFAAGTVAEDQLMVFRAIVSGGAITLPEPLVRYRRGGISRRRRNLRASDVIERMRKNSRHASIELRQLLFDAAIAGQLAAVEPELHRRLKRETFVHDVFEATGIRQRMAAMRAASPLPLAWRLRVLVYATCPAALAPFFALKRLVSRQS